MKPLRNAGLLFAVALLAACGTVATPVWQTPEPTPTRLAAQPSPQVVGQAGEQVASVPTATALPPTATPQPPTATPEPPTATPEAVLPTVEPTTAPAGGGGDAPMDEYTFNASIADPANGEVLFNTTFNVAGVDWACRTCHTNDPSGLRAIGPGQWGLIERAPTYMPAEYVSVAHYIHDSIINPSVYVVDTFVDQMPHGYGDILTEAEIYDLVAYLLTLHN